MNKKITNKDLLEFGVIKTTEVSGLPQLESSSDYSSNSFLNQNSQDSPEPSNTLPPTDKPEQYPGDYDDEDVVTEYQPLNFPNAAIMLAFIDKNIQTGTVKLHPWQIGTHEELSTIKSTSLHPYKFCLCAANGSGKDAFVLAPWVIWFAVTKRKSLVIITSSSGVQLTAQTENYIRSLAEAFNNKFGTDIFKIRQRYIKCLLTGSEIRMFATDEAGKAEGYHPLEPNAEMCIVVNEGKSVSEEIHGALKRCTGFNYWLEVSTPGEPFGFFYRAFTKWPHTKRITAYDCPHISPDEIENDRQELGETSALFRSMRLALFTSLGGNAVIPAELIEQLIINPPTLAVGHSWPIRIGIDLAAGGDENSIHAFRGNKKIFEHHWRESDTTITADQIHELLSKKLKINYDHEYIFIDDGNVGHSITDMLVRRGWKNIRRVLNQSAAFQKKRYGNRGVEMWSTFKRIVEERFIDVTQLSPQCRTQLANRYYKQQSTQGRIFLESKKEAKADGRPSPDRADSLVLCFSDLNLDSFIKENTPPEIKETVQLRTDDELRKWMEEEQFKVFNAEPNQKPAHGSLNVVMKRNNSKEFFNNYVNRN